MTATPIHSTKNQSAMLLTSLQRGPVTALQALDELGIARAAARVFDLRKAGHTITTHHVDVRNRRGETCHVAEYRLHPAAAATQGRAATC